MVTCCPSTKPPSTPIARLKSETRHGEVRGFDVARGERCVLGRDVHHADCVRAAPSGEAAAADDRDLLRVDETDAAGVENIEQAGIVRGRVAAKSRHRLAEVEDSGGLGKELPLLRKEQAEAGQVHDFLVGFHLREVGVIREVGDEIVGETDLEVTAVLGADIGVGLGQVISRRLWQQVRHELDPPS
jgi:hypothetical protein